jgi:hypothetical protein
LQTVIHLNSVRRAGFILALAGMLWAFLGGQVRASGVISGAAQPKLLKAFEPYAPGEQVVAPWRIKNIAIVHDRVEIELVTEDQATLMQLVPRGQSRTRRAQSRSFDILDPIRPVSKDSDTFDKAASALVQALQEGDKGGFYVRVGKRGEGSGGAASEENLEPSSGPLVPIMQVLLLGMLLAYILALIGFRRSGVAWFKGRPKSDAFAVFGLLGLASALRFVMGPYSLLHENFHAPVLIDQLAGTASAPRPMAGLAGLNEALDILAPFSFDRLFALMVLLSALQPLLVVGIARSLGLKRRAAWLAGVWVAAAPLYLRLASSELAFVPGTTALLLGVWLALESARYREPLLLCASAVCVSLAGHFRPVLYTCMLPVFMGTLVMLPPGEWKGWFKRLGVWGAGFLFLVFTADDILPIFAAMGEGTALAPGWWQSAGLRSWPVIDPEVTPIPFLVCVAVSLLALGWRGPARCRRPLLWSVGLLAWVSFWLTSMNGWPSALRYTSAYGWIPALWVAMAMDVWGTDSTKGRFVWVALVVAAVTQPLSHHTWIDKHYAPQVELQFQRDHVLHFLAEQEPSLVASPWRELDRVGGSFLVSEARSQGHRIVPHSLYKSYLERPDGLPVLYWYRGLTCWARSVSGSPGTYDERGFNQACRTIEEELSVIPVPGMTFLVEPNSDADWIQVGLGKERVEIGLFRATRR